MTNKQKFIEVMNDTFGAGFTEDNLLHGSYGAQCNGSPCGLMQKDKCRNYECSQCWGWWDKEYVPTAKS